MWVWQGRSSTRHRSGFLWAPPTQDTGRCSTRDIYWSLQAGGIRRADGKLVMTLAPLSSVCVDGWFILGCHDCSCTPGVQPHPARVQSVWLRPGEAVNQPSTTHRPFLNSKYADYVLADLEVRTWKVRTSSTDFREREYALAIGTAADSMTSPPQLC